MTRGAAWARGLAPVAVAVALVTAACSGTSTQKGASDNGSAGATANTFTYSVNSEVMLGWDPATDYSNEVIAMQNMYQMLTRYNPDTQQVEPLLATSWEKNADGTEWTFHLRGGVTFHTGRPMDSTAVKEAIERTMKLGEAASYIWSAVKSIDTPDPQTVVFHLSYASPLDLVASGDYSAYIYDTKAAGGGDLAKWFAEGKDAGTGPYTVDAYNPGDEIELRLKAYPDYWGGWDGSHYENLVFRVTPEATTAAQLLRSGQVSMVQRMTPQLWQTFAGDPKFQTETAPSWQTLLALLNTADGPLANENVRKAIALGIDYGGITSALHGAGQPLTGVVPPGLWGHSEDVPSYAHDPGQAAQLLQQEGYGPGGDPLQLELTYLHGDADEELVATLMKADLAKLNVDVEVRGLQWQAQWSQGKSSDPSKRQDIFLFYWWPDYPDPVSWFFNLFRTEDKPFFNLAYYSNQTLDKQIDQASTLAATDREQAASLYEQMQRELYADVPALPLYTQTYQRAMLSSVQGFEDNPAYPNVVFAYELTPTA
jgi:peptide/nickel transport system substrate-binding protein